LRSQFVDATVRVARYELSRHRSHGAWRYYVSTRPSGHDDIDTALERLELLGHRRPAVNREHCDAHRLPILVDRLRDLHRQLVSWRENQR
jgi:hypothetical protein